MGFPPIKAAQQAIYSKGLKYAKRKQAKRYTTAGTAAQIIGATDWNAKSWNQPRRVIARKRFDRRTCQLDLRLIQTHQRLGKRRLCRGIVTDHHFGHV